MKIKIIDGKDLSQKERQQIFQIRANEFSWWNISNNRKNALDEQLIFILYSSNKEMLSIWTLKSINVSFLEENYNILWIAWIVSVVKWKWHWKILMSEIMDYLKTSKKTWIWFCIRYNTMFYEKCWFKVIKDFISRFSVLGKENSNCMHPDWDTDVIYLEWEDKLFQKILVNKEECVKIPNWW